MLPIAYVASASDTLTPGSCSPTDDCVVVASIVAPTQSLANSTNVNYAGLYHSGSCVQAPVCPPDPNNQPMNATVMVVPASVTGVNDMPANAGTAGCSPTSTSGCQLTAYPLNSFTAYATGPSGLNTGPPTCSDPSINAPCTVDSSGAPLPTGSTFSYWRVCLAIATQKGFVQPSAPASAAQQSAWGQATGTVMVITRCAPAGEKNGSDFTVWSN